MEAAHKIQNIVDLQSQHELYKDLITFSAGTSIFEEDEKGNEAYFIQSGYVELSKYVNNKKKVVALLGPGEIFGEISLFDGKKRTAAATALHETVMLPISQQQLNNALSCEDPLSQLLVQSVIRRMRSMHEQSQEHAGLEGEGILPKKDIIFLESQKHASNHISALVKISKAVEQQQFQLNFQPIVNLKSGSLNGFEVLVRGPKHLPELFSPLSFISLAEESGLIVPLGEWILKTGLNSFRRFDHEAQRCSLSEELFISINVSPKQLDEEKNVKKIMEIIQHSGVEYKRIKLEITEDVLMSNPQKALAALNELKTIGVKISIDDFGTGYSSLNYLNRFPLDTLKIDRSFISQLSKNNGDNRIVTAIINLAHMLDMDIVAEGVEMIEDHEWLFNQGCEYGQGYFYDKPLFFEDAMKKITKRYVL